MQHRHPASATPTTSTAGIFFFFFFVFFVFFFFVFVARVSSAQPARACPRSGKKEGRPGFGPSKTTSGRGRALERISPIVKPGEERGDEERYEQQRYVGERGCVPKRGKKKERKKGRKKKKGTREEGAGYGAGRGGQGPSKPGGGFIDAAVRRFLNLPQPLFFSFSFFLFFSPLPFFSSPRRHLRSSTSVYRVDGSKNFHASIYGAWKIRYFPSFVRSFVRFPVFPVFSRGKRIRKGRELTNRRYSRGGG